MAEYVSRTTKDNYKIIFHTDKWEDYKEIQEAIRAIIDRNRNLLLGSKCKKLEQGAENETD